MPICTKKYDLFGSALFLCAMSCWNPSQVYATSYTDERINSKYALDIINVDTVYKQGYTGKGITIGVIDEAIKTDHPELTGKATATAPHFPDGTLFELSWLSNFHGTHVAGIIAAKRDGEGMHGIAYDANIAGATFLGAGEVEYYTFPVNVSNFFVRNPSMRIVNNSWGSVFYPLADQREGTEWSVDYARNKYLDISKDLANHTLNNPETLMVFSAGNAGHNSPLMEILIPRYFGSEYSNWLSVGALDLSSDGNITRNTDQSLSLVHTTKINGTNTTFSTAIGPFSNLAQGAERFTVFAPGTKIRSLYTANDGYAFLTGTSMAAPVVSGASGLVSQKYPWLSGKQLADAVLSTANDNFTAPDYMLSNWENYDLNTGEVTEGRINIIFVGSEEKDIKSVEEAMKYIEPVIRQSPYMWKGTLGTRNVDEAVAEIERRLRITDENDKEKLSFVVQELTKEEVFGQGILDVGKAMHGIAELDANRMTASHVQTIADLGGKSYALENFNTKGYNAVFSNDITQAQWDDKYHHAEYQTDGARNTNAAALNGKDIGIIKSGVGHLALLGTNTYKGATIVEGGTLSISKRFDNSGGKLTESDVIVRRGGTLAGNGTISQSVFNNGTLELRNAKNMGLGLNEAFMVDSTSDTLTVGTYTQGADGKINVFFDQGNYGKLNITNSAMLYGDIIFTPQEGYFASDTSLQFDVITNGNVNGGFINKSIDNNSQTLDMVLTPSSTKEDEFTLQITRPQNAYARLTNNSSSHSVGIALGNIAGSATDDMQNLVTAVDFSSDVDGALTILSPETFDKIGIASLRQQNTANSTITRRMLGNMHTRIQQKQASLDANEGMLLASTGYDGSLGLHFPKDKEPTWQMWGANTLGFSKQETSGTFHNENIGLMLGIDKLLGNGLQYGFHAITGTSETESDSLHNMQSDTTSYHLGVHGLCRLEEWDGFFLTGQARIGIEDTDMQRKVTIGSYERTNTSSWVDVSGALSIGGGKDWTMDNITFGPVAWLEYSFIKRPDITENGGGASRLQTEADFYQSLAMPLGVHIGATWDVDKNLFTKTPTKPFNVAVDLLGVWRQSLIDDDIETKGSFVGYDGSSFNSTSSFDGLDAFLLQTSVRLTQDDRFYIQADVGGEFAENGRGDSLNLGLSMGYTF